MLTQYRYEMARVLSCNAQLQRAAQNFAQTGERLARKLLAKCAQDYDARTVRDMLADPQLGPFLNSIGISTVPQPELPVNFSTSHNPFSSPSSHSSSPSSDSDTSSVPAPEEVSNHPDFSDPETLMEPSSNMEDCFDCSQNSLHSFRQSPYAFSKEADEFMHSSSDCLFGTESQAA
jgi:hypothetical protein